MKDDKNKQEQPTPHKMPQNHPRKAQMEDPESGAARKGEIENPDQSENPDKKIQIDDNPGETKKKIPSN
jgi:hypothetical protein